MTRNVLLVWPEIVGIVGGALILLLFGLGLAIPHQTARRPGSRGHRREDGDEEAVRPDGYIDSFAGVIEEAGGAYPLVVWLLIVGVLVWWLIYLIFNFITGGELPSVLDPQLGDQLRILFTR